jgi:uncharacterized protein (DUF2062 family)
VPRKFFRRYLPQPEAVLERPWAAPFRRWLGHPSLWHLNRRSVSGAVAIGLFCGLIPGPFQMLAALLIAIALRRNIPVALFVTLYTNPLTIVPLYLLAYGYGRLLLGGDSANAAALPYEWEWSMHAFWQWISSLGQPLLVGLPALALTLAVLGYFATDLAWRGHVISTWRARRRRRQRGESLD